MSVSIRHRYNYGNILINMKKVVAGGRVTGNTIPALRKDGSYLYLPFGGVIDDDVSNNKELVAVKLVNITGFWWNDMAMGSDCYEIPIGHAVKGFVSMIRYYVAIRADKPIHFHWRHERKTVNYHTDFIENFRVVPYVICVRVDLTWSDISVDIQKRCLLHHPWEPRTRSS